MKTGITQGLKGIYELLPVLGCQGTIKGGHREPSVTVPLNQIEYETEWKRIWTRKCTIIYIYMYTHMGLHSADKILDLCFTPAVYVYISKLY